MLQAEFSIRDGVAPVLPPCSSTGAHARRARRGRQRRGGMARGDPNLVWVEGFTSPVRLSDIIKPPRGYGLGPAQHAAAPARALWAAREAEPPPPPGRAVRGDDAVTQAPVRARPSRPQLIDRTQGGRRQPRAFSSGSRVRTPAAVCAELAGARSWALLTRRGWWTRRRPRRESAPLRTRSRARQWRRACRSAR